MDHQSQSIPYNWKGRFFTIWAGQAFSIFGSAIVQFALIWWLTQKSGSAMVLTIATLVGMLPQIVLGPFAGALVDRWNRRIVMITADATIAASSLLLAYLFSINAAQIWIIYVVMAVRSLGAAFHFPAMASSTPLMVPDQQLTRVNGLNQALDGMNRVIAPTTGALLVALLPTPGLLLIDVGTAMLAILPLIFISVPQPRRHEKTGQHEKPGLIQDVREALVFVRSWPGLVTIIFIAFFLNFLLAPTASLLPLVITKHFGRGATELGFMNSAEGLGIIAGGIILSIWGGFKKKMVTSMIGIIGLGIGVMLIGLAPASFFIVAIIGIMLVGVMTSIANGPLIALLQSTIPPKMLGRVVSLLGTGATMIAPLGLLIAGPVSDALGVQVWFWAGGALCVIIGIAGFFSPSLMNVETNKVSADTLGSKPI